MQFKNLFLFAISCALVVGCGGGGGGGSTQTTVTVQQPVSGALISSDQLVLPDVNEKANTICAGDLLRANIRIKTANLNNHSDGRKDLVVMISCHTIPAGTTTNNSYLSGILAFIQQSDGKFIDSTTAIFGTSILTTDGVLMNAVASDFNNDGYDDLVISVSSEDARASYTNAQYRKKQLALTSNGNGTYKSDLIGVDTLAEIIKITNNNGIKEVLVAGYGGGADQAFRYSNNQWQSSSYYGNITGTNPWAGWSSLPMSGSYYSTNSGAINAGFASDWLNNVYLFSKQTSNNGWTSVDQWSLPSSQLVNYTSWNGGTGSTPLYNVNGKDMMFLAFNVNCQITYGNATQPTTLFMTNAQQVSGGYKGQALTEGTSDFIPDTMFIALDEVNGKITQRQVSFTGSITNKLTTNNLQCTDYTGDGKKDLFVGTYGAVPAPIIFIDTGTGSYSLVNQNNFPSTNGDNNGAYYSLYEDIDGDGINDLLYYPFMLRSTKLDAIRINKGLRKISSTDVN